MTSHQDAIGDLRVVPANLAAWDDLQAVFGTRGAAHRCQCQRQIWADRIWYDMPFEERAANLHEQTACGDPDAESTSGLVAYATTGSGEEPVGWIAVEPRTAYRRIRNSPVAWKGRDEDRDDDGVWAIACMIVRAGHRRQGITTPLVAAAFDHACAHGARAVEGYPMITTPGVEITWDELSVGPLNAFLDAGFREVGHPTKRRMVVRREP